MFGRRWDAADLALGLRADREYDEGAFLYFLGVERSRADRANHVLRLLLAAVEPAPGRPVRINRVTAAGLFAGLRASLRETDVMGWYRQDRVAGAVLSARTDAPGADTSSVIRQRVGAALRRRLPPAAASCLRVRVIRLRRQFGSK